MKYWQHGTLFLVEGEKSDKPCWTNNKEPALPDTPSLEIYRQINNKISVSTKIPASGDKNGPQVPNPPKYSRLSNTKAFERWLNALLWWLKVNKICSPELDLDHIKFMVMFLENITLTWFEDSVDGAYCQWAAWTFKEVITSLYNQFVHEMPPTMQLTSSGTLNITLRKALWVTIIHWSVTLLEWFRLPTFSCSRCSWWPGCLLTIYPLSRTKGALLRQALWMIFFTSPVRLKRLGRWGSASMKRST